MRVGPYASGTVIIAFTKLKSFCSRKRGLDYALILKKSGRASTGVLYLSNPKVASSADLLGS